jgi:carboxylesterase type B
MSVIAATDLGALAGEAGDGVVLFRNVPYAAPPTGERRFAAPHPASPWEGIRNATRHGPIAPQPPSRLRAAMGDFERPQSEDCLTLTIATPAADDGTRPVIVWLHGGAYMTGAGSLDWYEGGVLARDGDCVVVGVNYRLGALGFLHHPAIGVANCALLDMIAALGWVRDHIAAFGGDPGQVTVMGQSAGAHAIMCLLTMPDARGLFHRAILQSAPPAMTPLSAPRDGIRRSAARCARHPRGPARSRRPAARRARRSLVGGADEPGARRRPLRRHLAALRAGLRRPRHHRGLRRRGGGRGGGAGGRCRDRDDARGDARLLRGRPRHG